jgi:hypothetical protein
LSNLLVPVSLILSLSLSLTCSFLHVFYHSTCRSPRPDNNGREHSHSSTGNIVDHQKHVKVKGKIHFFLLSNVNPFLPFHVLICFLYTKRSFSKESLFLFFLLFVWKRDFKPRLRYMGMVLIQKGKFQPDPTLFTTTATQQDIKLSMDLSIQQKIGEIIGGFLTCFFLPLYITLFSHGVYGLLSFVNRAVHRRRI